MAKINVRSPYHIFVSDAQLTSATLELWVYTGTKTTSRPTLPNYTLNSTATGININFEVSLLIRDFINSTFDGNYSSNAVWVDYRVTKVINSVTQTPDAIQQLTAFNGYGYFEDGINPQVSDKLLMSNRVVYKLNDTSTIIPVQQDKLNSIFYFKGSTIVKTKTFTSTAVSSDIIRYVSFSNNYALDYKSRVIADGGTFEDSVCLKTALDDIILYDFDKIQFNFTDGIEIVRLQNIEECKHTPYILTFINKYGAFQNLWFFKRSDLSLSVTKETYKSNILDLSSSNYSISNRQYTDFNIVGKEVLKLNSGFVPEDYNEVFRQLMLSERVWIYYEEKTLPVNIKSSNIDFRKTVNDKMINYTIELDFAFDKINNIR